MATKYLKRIGAALLCVAAATAVYGVGQIVPGPQSYPAPLSGFVFLLFAHVILGFGAVALLVTGAASLFFDWEW